MATPGEIVDEALGIAGRLALLVGVSAAMLFVLGVALKPALPSGLPPGPAGRTFFALMLVASVAVGSVVTAAIREKQRWEVIGFAADGLRPVALLVSLGIGLAGAALPGVLLLATGQAALEPRPPGAGLGAYAAEVGLALLATALLEELIYRGYLLGLLEERWGAVAAILTTGVLYALSHLFAPAATPLALLGTLTLGVLLGVVRVRTRSLLASWLTSAGFLGVQVLVFHGPLNGGFVGAPPIFRWEASGAAWLTGGRWGIEASAATAATLLVVSFLLFHTRPTPRRSARD